MKVLNATKLFTVKWLILRHVNFTSIGEIWQKSQNKTKNFQFSQAMASQKVGCLLTKQNGNRRITVLFFNS